MVVIRSMHLCQNNIVLLFLMVVFTAEQIGCKVNRLYNIGLPDGMPYDGKRCLITQEAIHSKAQKSPFTG
ncbi:hypothetical protein INE84_00131 [Bacteroides uniformis]|nr:hypothetical protein INE84_00131 [Bacteroides uniformis]